MERCDEILRLIFIDLDTHFYSGVTQEMLRQVAHECGDAEDVELVFNDCVLAPRHGVHALYDQYYYNMEGVGEVVQQHERKLHCADLKALHWQRPSCLADGMFDYHGHLGQSNYTEGYEIATRWSLAVTTAWLRRIKRWRWLLT